MDLTARRERLQTGPCPGNRLDYVVSLSGRVANAAADGAARVAVRYVPDKWILDPASFRAYLANLETLELDSLEAVGVAILDDLNNEVVPRWVQVSVSAAGGDAEARESHGVLLEDRQPRWDNPALLSRLKTL